MLWLIAAIVIVTIGTMAIIDAYFEGVEKSHDHILNQYIEGVGDFTDLDVWYSSYLLYVRTRPKDS